MASQLQVCPPNGRLISVMYHSQQLGFRNMARLMRVTGRSGATIYSGEYITEEKAKEYYLDDHGHEASRVDTFSFDECKPDELKKFAATGTSD